MKNLIRGLVKACLGGALFLNLSCSEKDPLLEPGNHLGTDFTSFSLLDSNADTYSSFLIRDSVIHVKVPNTSALNHLIASYEVNGEEVELVTVTDTEGNPDFSNFLAPVRYKVISHTGETKEWIVQLYDLPVLILNTPDCLPITSKEVRTEGCELTLIDDNGNILPLGTAGVRGRGNSTWTQPKKPYNIKLDKKAGMLGMNPSKHWILLANAYYDRTQLHYAAGFELARLTDNPWVPQGKFIELILNGKHQGLYYLCEKIRVEKDKINIKEMTPEDLEEPELTGGYLLESFVAGENKEHPIIEDYCFQTDFFTETGPYWARRPLGWEIKSPDEDKIQESQKSYIMNSLNHLESLLWDDSLVVKGEYRNYLDIESFINWWLVEEACTNMEASKSKNIYMYKDRDSIFKMGPPWDFDAYTFGHYGVRCFLCKDDALYYKQLFKDPVFVNRVKEKWVEYKNEWQIRIPVFIDQKYSEIHRAAERNEVMWPSWLNVNKYPEKSYSQIIDDMKNYLEIQLQWMDSQITSF